MLVVEMVIKPENTVVKRLDLEMFVIPGGRKRTKGENEKLFNTASFKLSQIMPHSTHRLQQHR